MRWESSSRQRMTGVQVSGSMGGYLHLNGCIKGNGLHICYPAECILVLQKNTYSTTSSGICFAERENKGTPICFSFWHLETNKCLDSTLLSFLQASSRHCSAQSEILSSRHHWGYAQGVLHRPFNSHSGTKISTLPFLSYTLSFH